MEITVQAISERLAAQAESVAKMLLPGGAVDHGQWVCGDLSGNPGKSLKVCTHGNFAGQWRDWSTDDHGDLLDLWRMTKDLSPGDAVKEAKAWLGIVDPVREYTPKKYSAPPEIKSTPPNPEGKAMAYLTKVRKLTPETISAFKIEACAEKRSIVFPSYSPSGVLLNRSYRTIDSKKRVWQDSDCAPSVFGWQAVPDSAYKSRTILLAEGQIDAASWFQWGIPALSIPNGTGCSWIEYDWDNLACFDTFYLAFDQDEAGQKITETVMARLGRHKCMIVNLPKKDANACLQEGYTATDAEQWIANAKSPKIKRLITGSELEDRLIAECRVKPMPFTLSFFKKDWPHTGFYFRPGEVTVWGGFAGAGKTTMLTFMKSNLLADQLRTFEASLEIKAEVNMRKLATTFLGARLDEDSARQFIRSIGEHLVFADVVGSMKTEELMEMMWFAFRRYGVTHFIIDSLMRLDGLEEDYPAQGQFCNDLQSFAKETGAHIHLVAHLAKPSGSAERPSMYAVKGSSLIVNNSDNVLLICRNPDKEKLRKANKLTPEQDQMMHDTEVIVEKHRETGWLHTFRLKFNPHRYTYSKM